VGSVEPACDGDCGVLARPAVDLPQGVHIVETTGVDRQLISSGAAFEDRVGYSRAVRVGRHVWVSGTAPIMPDDADPPEDTYEQARVCLEIIERTLAEAGAGLDDVVRTRIYVTRAEDIDAAGRAHREAFGDIRPATTGIVTALLDPRWRVEIEAEAVIVVEK
jgi:enamine deaminase RidA (YjgF/YER057c/UK114 family)